MRRTCALFAIAAGFLSGQEQPKRLTFEVISIKAWKPGQPGGGIMALPGGQEYNAIGAPVLLMISLMYKVPQRQITGGPDWLNTDRWNVDAKADHPGYSLDDLHLMFQNMLADEFKLKFHRETREGPVYDLVVDKGGLKMKENKSPEPYKVPINGGPAGSIGTRVPMQYLTWWLSQIVQQDGRPVVNKTGLDGNYDFALSFMPELPPDFPRDKIPQEVLDRPDIFKALRDQLGLRLEPGKGPVEYFVIDSAQKPSDN